MKICKTCLTAKNETEFSIYSYTKKIKPHCKECLKKYNRINGVKNYKSKCSGIPFIENEIWVKIEGFENYFVSNLGRVKRNEKNILIPEKTNRGYLRVLLSENGSTYKKSIHRLVAIAFIENKENKPYVNHKDFNKENNSFINLEWVTHMENCLHYIQNKRNKNEQQ